MWIKDFVQFQGGELRFLIHVCPNETFFRKVCRCHNKDCVCALNGYLSGLRKLRLKTPFTARFLHLTANYFPEKRRNSRLAEKTYLCRRVKPYVFGIVLNKKQSRNGLYETLKKMKMEFTAKMIAEVLGGTIEGDENARVHTLSKIENGKPGTLSFLANPAYTPYIYDTQASIVIVKNDFAPEKPVKATLIRVENPYASFAKLLEMYAQTKEREAGISAKADVAPTAKIGKNVYIGAFVSIGENTEIGDNCKIYPNTTIGYNCKIGSNTKIYQGCNIYDDTVIGNHCTLHAGVVVGSDGFGFAPQGEDYKKVPQIGNVIIEDWVEIGANTTIDRATLESTVIRKGVKLDNLIQIAHNVEIGENTVIAAQTGISGSTKVGKNCMIGGQVGMVGHITVADEVKIAAQSGIGKSIKEKGAVVEGSPAFGYRDFQRSYVHFRRFDRIVKRVDALERKLKNG